MKITESFADVALLERQRFVLSRTQSRSTSRRKIDRDSMADDHVSQGNTVPEGERWLSPNLNYERRTGPAVAADSAVHQAAQTARCGWNRHARDDR